MINVVFDFLVAQTSIYLKFRITCYRSFFKKYAHRNVMHAYLYSMSVRNISYYSFVTRIGWRKPQARRAGTSVIILWQLLFVTPRRHYLCVGCRVRELR
jgi:hypothetical protein